jgi:hypothetical protein
MKALSSKVAGIASSATLDIADRAKAMAREGIDVISLSIGEPDFDTPACIRAAGDRALAAGKTHYTHSLGLLELREAICDYYERRYRVRISPEQVIVTSGTSPAPSGKPLLPDPGTMKTAEGKWYESIIYETILRCSGPRTRSGRSSPRARTPVPAAPGALGQNGLFYSRSGDIKVRGNGQDLAELDLLLVGEGRSIAFGEIVTSPAAMKELETEILYKKRLMGHLFGQEVVPALLVSSVDISRISAAFCWSTRPTSRRAWRASSTGRR